MEFEEGKIRELAPGVLLRSAVDNSLWADLGDGVAVVDALEDPDLAPVIAQAVAGTTGKKIRWVLNTHWHGDHTACNAAWAQAGAQIIAHASVGAPSDAPNGRPNIVFTERYTLQGAAGRQVEMEWLGGTHTAEDSVVFFPWARVLHVGDLFGWGLIPLRAINETTAARLREVYGRLLSYDAAVVVPGHGPTLSPAELRRFLAYFDDLLARVPALCRSGLSPAAVEQRVPPPEDMRDWWRFTDWKHGRNVARLCE